MGHSTDHTYRFRQIGTRNFITVTGNQLEEARQSAARKLDCRQSSCLLVPDTGMVKVFVLKNWETKQKHKIKGDSFDLAREEIAAATGTEISEWVLRGEETADDCAARDIEYLTFDSGF